MIKQLNSWEKLKILGEGSKFDVCGFPSIFTKKKKKFQRFGFIYPAVGRKGSCVNLFKVLQSNACEGNCFYCANRKDRNFSRIEFSPQELAKLFLLYYKKGLVNGLFLSSAIYQSSDKSEEKMLKTIELLRYKYSYRGYIHYKILPGTSESLIEGAWRLADRLSINLEAPGPKYLERLSPTKKFSSQLLEGLKKIAYFNEKKPLRAGITTQLVVGAAGETDKEILNFSFKLYENYKLWRIYYSAFMPILQTPLEELPPCPLMREYRLYQADFLLRGYNFSPEEIPFEKDGNLSLKYDPKLAWALKNPHRFPVEINKAEFDELIRVPGIGKISAKRIIETRKIHRFTNLNELKETGAVVKRAQNFITLSGKFYPAPGKSEPEPDQQLFLWEEI
ncbi:putative DNA modification/repair radical SAM protein [Candidatus Aerophobetes bacterium]|nr:putative DNA modification/repair radical SAM protein [Candidatus Aerophobetes bacterium]